VGLTLQSVMHNAAGSQRIQIKKVTAVLLCSVEDINFGCPQYYSLHVIGIFNGFVETTCIDVAVKRKAVTGVLSSTMSTISYGSYRVFWGHKVCS